MLRDNNENEDMAKASIAATKIQANFRGYRVRKQLKELNKDSKAKSFDTVDRRCDQQWKGRLMEEKAVKVEKTKERSSIVKNENVMRELLEEKSATKIQAQVRGFLVRKRQQMAQAAATKIQASFRGFRTRRLLKRNEQ
ncbi:uncharacterized protein LOC143179891 isoform X1 [Calliopsis andreniformis]|uniref:uncharacterized protein LOC143179891 isoform X1 n=1 Tax=Calliopsis andreniformis TaxID=337506 RepID=UPI003FCEB5F5